MTHIEEKTVSDLRPDLYEPPRAIRTDRTMNHPPRDNKALDLVCWYGGGFLYKKSTR